MGEASPGVFSCACIQLISKMALTIIRSGFFCKTTSLYHLTMLRNGYNLAANNIKCELRHVSKSQTCQWDLKKRGVRKPEVQFPDNFLR